MKINVSNEISSPVQKIEEEDEFPDLSVQSSGVNVSGSALVVVGHIQ